MYFLVFGSRFRLYLVALFTKFELSLCQWETSPAGVDCIQCKRLFPWALPTCGRCVLDGPSNLFRIIPHLGLSLGKSEVRTVGANCGWLRMPGSRNQANSGRRVPLSLSDGVSMLQERDFPQLFHSREGILHPLIHCRCICSSSN